MRDDFNFLQYLINRGYITKEPVLEVAERPSTAPKVLRTLTTKVPAKELIAELNRVSGSSLTARDFNVILTRNNILWPLEE